jgi:guanidinopropionase
MTDDERLAVMRSVYWWGPATFFGCEHDPDPASCDIALVGVPHSTGNGSTERDQHLGPRAVRHVSGHYRRIHRKLGIDPWSACRINDVGDVVMPEFMVSDKAVRDIEAHFREIDRAGARPVSVGGDHSITLPILRAVAGAGSRAGRPVALVHLDAHYDTFDRAETWYGVVDSAGHWASRAVREGLVDASRSVQVGRRGHPSRWAHLNVSRELGYRVIEKEEVDEVGVAGVVAEIRERAGDLPVYVSFDLDVLDPAAAPAVSNLELGEEGFTMKEALQMLQGLRGLDVIGGDLVCFIPTKDAPNQITAMNSVAVLFELICLIADRLVAQDGKGD